MSDTFKLMPRDREILQALSLKVRLFTQRQVAAHWFGGELVNARRRLKRLAEADLLQRISVQARPLPPLESALIRWQVGDPAPDFGAVAYRCQHRWRMRPPRRSAAWIATERTAQLFGGVRRGELKQPTQATHDLGLAAVWLRFRKTAPQWADAWRGEDLLAHTRKGEKLPDAFLVDGRGEVIWVIEFGGGYDTLRVAAFHADCAARSLPYQLW